MGRRYRKVLVSLICVLCGWAGAAHATDPAPPLVAADAATILAAVKEQHAGVTLVNVWATWCNPCVEEFPDLVRLRKNYLDRGLRVLLVSADFSTEKDAALAFLAKQGVDFPTYIKDGDDMKFIEALCPQWSGAMPATFLYDSKGQLVHFREGKASYEALEREVQAALKRSPKEPS